jgi:hypothetical protein
MESRRCCESACYDHAQQRSLYRHAVNALLLASRSGCDSDLARELAERCMELLRAADRVEEQSVAAHP